MSTHTTEREILERVVPELEAEGYEVYLHPNRPLLPPFLAGYVPDAVALGPGKNLAVEVVRKSPQATRKLKRIQALFEGQDKWELRVIWVAPASANESLQVQTSVTIKQRIGEVRALAAQGHLGPSLLLAWATFEALARAVVSGEFERPQTPGRLVQVLAQGGYLTPTEADELRRLAD
jgi:REase_AHJR-like